MNANQPPDRFYLTHDYYEENAEAFAQRTKDIDLSPLYEEFLPLLPSGGYILDAGCGTGRDSEAFLERGFRVLAFDASRAMVSIASKRIGQPVLHISFDQMPFDHEFDGVWAAASLLHVPKEGMERVFRNLHDALVPNGVLYASFKRGHGEEFREGRFFNDYDEKSLQQFVSGQRQRWEIVKLWRTGDIGQQRRDVQWVNLLARAR